jgi:hypothetical protein
LSNFPAKFSSVCSILDNATALRLELSNKSKAGYKQYASKIEKKETGPAANYLQFARFVFF